MTEIHRKIISLCKVIWANSIKKETPRTYLYVPPTSQSKQSEVAKNAYIANNRSVPKYPRYMGANPMSVWVRDHLRAEKNQQTQRNTHIYTHYRIPRSQLRENTQSNAHEKPPITKTKRTSGNLLATLHRTKRPPVQPHKNQMAKTTQKEKDKRENNRFRSKAKAW